MAALGGGAVSHERGTSVQQTLPSEEVGKSRLRVDLAEGHVQIPDTSVLYVPMP